MIHDAQSARNRKRLGTEPDTSVNVNDKGEKESDKRHSKDKNMSASLPNKLADRIDTELLISLVKLRPALWDRGLDAHRDRDQRSAAWRDVCRALCSDYDALARADKHLYAKLVIKRWTNIRDGWRRSYVDAKLKKKTKPYYYHDHLRFLEKNLYHVKESFPDDDDSRKSRDNDDREIISLIASDDDSCGDRARKRKWELQEVEHPQGKSLVQVEENPHVCFIRGLLPTLNRLTDDQTLEFQAGVIQLLQTLKKRRAPVNEAPGSDDSNWSLTTRGSETDPLYLHEETPLNTDLSEEKPRLRHRAIPTDLQKLLDNQQLMIENQMQMKKDQQKMAKALAEISAKLDSKIAKPAALTLNYTSSCNTTEFRPIKNLQELDTMEAKLEDSEVYNEYKMKYSIVCGPGKGLNCAYQFCDLLFDREFLTKCSWAGGSRSETTKISLKTYKNVLNFFFDMVHDCDQSYTIEDNMNFFKTILRNSMKRSMAKLQRKSTSRCRRQRPSEELLALLDNADASADSDDTSIRNSVTETLPRSDSLP